MTLINLSNILVIFQLELWREFAKQRKKMQHKHVMRLIQIMIAIPVNTGWLEQAYTKLVLITKRRKKLLVDKI